MIFPTKRLTAQPTVVEDPYRSLDQLVNFFFFRRWASRSSLTWR